MTQDDAHCTALNACAKLVRVPKMASAFFIVVRQVLLSQWFTFLHSSIERFSFEYRKTKTKVITLANHKGHRQNSEPIKTRSNYM